MPDSLVTRKRVTGNEGFMKDIEVRVGAEDQDPQPLCPFCEKDLEVVNDHRSHLKLLYNLHVFSCPHCRRVLGVSTVLK